MCKTQYHKSQRWFLTAAFFLALEMDGRVLYLVYHSYINLLSVDNITAAMITTILNWVLNNISLPHLSHWWGTILDL